MLVGGLKAVASCHSSTENFNVYLKVPAPTLLTALSLSLRDYCYKHRLTASARLLSRLAVLLQYYLYSCAVTSAINQLMVRVVSLAALAAQAAVLRKKKYSE
eukprot:4938-Heterococcus_DN1.PRE.1